MVGIKENQAWNEDNNGGREGSHGSAKVIQKEEDEFSFFSSFNWFLSLFMCGCPYLIGYKF